jgi:hypothetical protein
LLLLAAVILLLRRDALVTVGVVLGTMLATAARAAFRVRVA